ncbi:UVR8 [Scenedesmus sp. PABB004]|nr:UVR8 [Scenedesmus sp. PABB004]
MRGGSAAADERAACALLVNTGFSAAASPFSATVTSVDITLLSGGPRACPAPTCRGFACAPAPLRSPLPDLLLGVTPSFATCCDACAAVDCGGSPRRSPPPQLDSVAEATMPVCCQVPVLQRPLASLGVPVASCDGAAAAAAATLARALLAQLAAGLPPERAALLESAPSGCVPAGRRRLLGGSSYTFAITTRPDLNASQALDAARALAAALGVADTGAVLSVSDVVARLNAAYADASADAVARLVQAINGAIDAAGGTGVFSAPAAGTGFVQVVTVARCDSEPATLGVNWPIRCAGALTGDVCAGVCDSGFGTRTATCGSDGTWSVSGSACEAASGDGTGKGNVGTATPIAGKTLAQAQQTCCTVPVAVPVAAGTLHTCWLHGTTRCSGDNTYGQLSISSTTTPSSATPVRGPGLTGVVALAAGEYHTCAVLRNGTAECWGRNDAGQLGGAPGTSHRAVVRLGSPIHAVAAGSAHTCAIAGGEAWCWGLNDRAQLGILRSTLLNSTQPVKVAGVGPGIDRIAARGAFTCAGSSSTVWCWGTLIAADLPSSVGQFFVNAAPAPVASMSGAASIAIGSAHVCWSLPAASTVRCFGSNGRAQLGAGFTLNYINQNSWLPVDLPGPAYPPGATCTDANGDRVAGDWVACDGTDKANAGNNTDVGNKTVAEAQRQCCTAPAAAVVAAAAGYAFSCWLLGGGTARCSGLNDYGQLGVSSTAKASSAAPLDVPGLTGAVALAAADNHACALLRNGSAQCWGYSHYGQLGGVLGANGRSVVQLGSPIQSIAAGGMHTCMLDASQEVSCAGDNGNGQLGVDPGTVRQSATPRLVPGVSGAVAVDAQFLFTCAVLSDGTDRCWGTVSYVGTNPQSPALFIHTNLPPTRTSSLTGITSIAVGESHVCALVSGGARCWGWNGLARLGVDPEGPGQPALVDGTAPTSVPLPRPATALAAGAYHTCALLDDGTIHCWGANRGGQLGNGGATAYALPGPVTGLGSAVRTITAGNYHTCAVLVDGRAQCWGSAFDGELGSTSAAGLNFSATPLLVD